jgi:hypothetical protein
MAIFEQMFEYSDLEPTALSGADGVVANDGVPIEFFYKGRAFHVHSLLTKWKETGQWWKQVSSNEGFPSVEEKTFWRVEAAPVGAVNTFEIEFNQATNTWQVRPTSRGI